MKKPEDMSLEELRDELRDVLISPNVDEMDWDELVSIKEDMDAQELQNGLVWSGPTTKEELLDSINKTKAEYVAIKEHLKGMDNIRWKVSPFIKCVCEALELLEDAVKQADLPNITEPYCNYTYEITNSTISLNQCRFRWEGTECSCDEETELLSLPVRPVHFLNGGYEMEGSYTLYDE